MQEQNLATALTCDLYEKLLTCCAGVLEKIGIEPQVQRIGKYKSAGDQLTRKNISEENREMLTALLDNIYGNWLDKVSVTKGNRFFFEVHSGLGQGG